MFVEATEDVDEDGRGRGEDAEILEEVEVVEGRGRGEVYVSLNVCCIFSTSFNRPVRLADLGRVFPVGEACGERVELSEDVVGAPPKETAGVSRGAKATLGALGEVFGEITVEVATTFGLSKGEDLAFNTGDAGGEVTSPLVGTGSTRLSGTSGNFFGGKGSGFPETRGLAEKFSPPATVAAKGRASSLALSKSGRESTAIEER